MSVPKHRQIESDLRNLVSGRKFNSHQQFYSQSELMQMFDANQQTVNKAINSLIGDKLLYTIHGKGTFIAPRVKVKKILIINRFNIDRIDYSDPYAHRRLDGLEFTLQFSAYISKHHPEFEVINTNIEDFDKNLVNYNHIYCDVEGVVLYRDPTLVMKFGSFFDEHKVPYLFYGSDSWRDKITAPYSHYYDEKKNAEIIINYLASKGHTNLFLTGEAHQAVELSRVSLLEKKAAKLKLNYTTQSLQGVTKSDVAALAEMVLSQQKQVTAIVCTGDAGAQLIMNYLVKKGVQIPEQISITGVNNLAESYRYVVPLTTLELPLWADAEIIAETLCKIIRGEATEKITYSKTRMVERESVKNLNIIKL